MNAALLTPGWVYTMRRPVAPIAPVTRGGMLGAPSQTVQVSYATIAQPYSTSYAPAGSLLLVTTPSTGKQLASIQGGGTLQSNGGAGQPVRVLLDGTPGTLKVSWTTPNATWVATVNIVGASAGGGGQQTGQSFTLLGGERYLVTVQAPAALPQKPTAASVSAGLSPNFQVQSVTVGPAMRVAAILVDVAQTVTVNSAVFALVVGAPGGWNSIVTAKDMGPTPGTPSPSPPQAPLFFQGGHRYAITVTAPPGGFIYPPSTAQIAAGLGPNFAVAYVTSDPSMVSVSIVADVSQSALGDIGSILGAVSAPPGATVAAQDLGPTPPPPAPLPPPVPVPVPAPIIVTPAPPVVITPAPPTPVTAPVSVAAPEVPQPPVATPVTAGATGPAAAVASSGGLTSGQTAAVAVVGVATVGTIVWALVRSRPALPRARSRR